MALDRALCELKSEVDEVLHLGDLIHEYRFSTPVVSRVRRASLRGVLGNHDAGYLRHVAPGRSMGVDQADLDYLKALPHQVDMEVDGRTVRAVHASPFPPYRDYLNSGSAELRRCAELDVDVLLLGHTHVPLAERHGDTVVVNPGSLGELRDPLAGRLTFVVLDVELLEVYLHRFADPVGQAGRPTEVVHLPVVTVPTGPKRRRA